MEALYWNCDKHRRDRTLGAGNNDCNRRYICRLIRALLETRLRRGAHRIEPAADVHLGMSFTAVMPGSGRIGGFRIPSIDGEIGISAPNHEPVGGIRGHKATDFASEFLQRSHSLQFFLAQWPVRPSLRNRGLS